MTYRELLEAIEVAQEMEQALEDARTRDARWNKHFTPEEQDAADAALRAADKALDREIRFS